MTCFISSGTNIVPSESKVVVADIDELFAGYDGSFVPVEDGFTASCGEEELF